MAQAGAYAQAPTPAYKISKSALNSLTVQYAMDYAKDGFMFFALSPGVRTRFLLFPPIIFLESMKKLTSAVAQNRPRQ